MLISSTHILLTLLSLVKASLKLVRNSPGVNSELEGGYVSQTLYWLDKIM